MAAEGRIATNSGLFFLLAKLTAKIGVYLKNKKRYPQPSNDHHSWQLSSTHLSSSLYLSLIETKETLRCRLTKEIHHKDFFFPPAFDPNVRLLLYLHFRSPMLSFDYPYSYLFINGNSFLILHGFMKQTKLWLEHAGQHFQKRKATSDRECCLEKGDTDIAAHDQQILVICP